MIQPCGRVCGFDPSQHMFLRTSPIVCAVDTLSIFWHFANGWYSSGSPFRAARDAMDARHETKHSARQAAHGGMADTSAATPAADSGGPAVMLMKIATFAIGTFFGFAKLLAIEGIPWTKTWACCYFGSYVVVFVMDNVLGRFATDKKKLQEDPEAPVPLDRAIQASDATHHNLEESNKSPATIDTGHDIDPRIGATQPLRQRRRMSYDMQLGCVAVLLQLAALSYVDLAVLINKPADEDPWVMNRFRFFRFLGTALAISIHYAFKTALGGNGATFRAVPCVLSLFIVCLLTFMKDLTYTHLYFFWSIAVALGSWLLFLTPGTRSLVAPFGRGDWTNVASFDFFCRVVSLSVFWYLKAYDPVGTYYPTWSQNVFG